MRKKRVEQYDHPDKQRLNNPPVGLVTSETDPPPPPERARTTYRYDPHLDPALNFDPKAARDELAAVIESGLLDEPPAELPPSSDELDRIRAELEGARAERSRARQALISLQRAQEPYLDWAGKAERTSFAVPTVSLHVHERMDPKTIIEAVRARNGNAAEEQLGLFEQPELNPPLRDAVEFYKHPHGWTNRLIAGDSLLVMSSLLEKEGMAGKVQMVYIDPPYGIRYRSNFQPFVSQRSVADTDSDEDLTKEPETLRAFRDTWELGIHSYLSYLRDRLWLAKELLHPTGSVFVQIDDDNVHRVRSVLDEVFGADCFVVTIPIKKKGSQKSGRMDPVNDYLLWYGRSSRRGTELPIKFRPLYVPRRLDFEALDEFKHAEMPDGTVHLVRELKGPDGLVRDYRLEPERFLKDFPEAKLFRLNPLKAGGTRKNQSLPYTIDGKTYEPGTGRCWKHTVRTDDGSLPGMDRLRIAGRLVPTKADIRFKSYFDDFGYQPMSNWWDGLGGASDPIYVVQTNEEIVSRCVLMTTDPGDIVLDPTCGSGTTAVVAEKWARRWITCDSSRVAIALAKQRLCTQPFEYYRVREPERGIASGFEYNTVPHIQPSDIANNPAIKEGMTVEAARAVVAQYANQRTLVDRPKKDPSRVRVSGPFTVEAVPAPVVMPIADPGAMPAADVAIFRSTFYSLLSPRRIALIRRRRAVRWPDDQRAARAAPGPQSRSGRVPRRSGPAAVRRPQPRRAGVLRPGVLRGGVRGAAVLLQA